MAKQGAGGSLPLYEQLANEVAEKIAQGVFRPGERLPSVRATSQRRGLSVTTVLEAYHLLEDRRLIEARPQSGYYVRRGPRPAAACRPRPSARSGSPGSPRGAPRR